MDNQILIDQKTETKFFAILALVLVLFLVVSFVVGNLVRREDVSTPSETAQKEFPQVYLNAKAAYVYDIRTKTVLFALNENDRLPLASLTKVMTALVASNLSPEFGVVTINSDALAVEGDSGLLKDERWSLKNLLDFSLVSSSNDGMRAVALALGALSKSDATSDEIINDFVGAMNKTAGELGLRNTYFWNETGLDESEVKGGAYGSAKDMSLLLEYILSYDPEILSATREEELELTSLDNYSHLARNTNSIVSEIPGLLASKTGYTQTAGGNLAIIFDPELGRPITVVILGSTEKGRFQDVKTLVDATIRYINGE